MIQIKKQLALLLLIFILIIPAIHKLTDQIPPDWFIGKFQDSLIGKVSGGITLSFWLIILLEIIGPMLLLIALFQMILKQKYQPFLSGGFLVCYLLFLILTFGSFLVQDYDNGFKDFLYFVGVIVIERFYFDKNSSM